LCRVRWELDYRMVKLTVRYGGKPSWHGFVLYNTKPLAPLIRESLRPGAMFTNHLRENPMLQEKFGTKLQQNQITLQIWKVIVGGIIIFFCIFSVIVLFLQIIAGKTLRELKKNSHFFDSYHRFVMNMTLVVWLYTLTPCTHVHLYVMVTCQNLHLGVWLYTMTTHAYTLDLCNGYLSDIFCIANLFWQII